MTRIDPRPAPTSAPQAGASATDRLSAGMAGRGLVTMMAVLLGLAVFMVSTARAASLEAALSAVEAGDHNLAVARSASLSDPVARKFVQWARLKEGLAPFGTIAAFMTANPNWPHQRTLQRAAERALTGAEDPTRLLAWFRAHPPITTEGKVALADAQLAGGNMTDAAQAARDAWRTGFFGQSEESSFISKFGRFLNAEDHKSRLSALLWDDRIAEARRMLGRVDAGQRALAEARISLISNAGGVDAAIARVPGPLLDDPGLVYDRLVWRRKRDMVVRAAELLFHPSANLGDARAWGRERAYLGRELLQSGQARTAYQVFAGHGQDSGITFATGEWTAGWIALRQLGDPARALNHFVTMHAGVSYPQSLSRAAYWAGRAAQALGRGQQAQDWYRKAAQHAETFYGQLAIEALGQSLADHLAPAPTPTDADRARLANDERMHLIRLLDRAGFADMAPPFVLALYEDAQTPGFRALVGQELAATSRPDLAVFFARKAALSGTSLLETGYPLPPSVVSGVRSRVSTGPQPEDALMLGLIRQESNFNTEAVSRAGARGLMQLMPRTAQRTALRLNETSSRLKLTADPGHNVRLGTAYFAGLLDEFAGSYVLAIAGYNAGPGRSRRWMRENGDPRRMDVHGVIDWIEHISFSETRNYVQRVLEGAQVYRHRLAEGGPVRTRLSDDLTR